MLNMLDSLSQSAGAKLPRKTAPAKGFTLIELLIVIAIILILIAIALPNFLEAQIRARVARAKGELRSLGIAMESYALDWKVYPPETEGDFRRGRTEFGHGWLTSPIKYIAAVPEDPFALDPQGNDPRRTYESGGAETGGPFLGNHSCTPCMVTWVIYSSAPSGAAEPVIRSAEPHYSSSTHQSNVQTFSPTNGTRSGGVIMQWGGDPFWIGVRLPNANRNGYSPSVHDSPLVIDGIPYLHRLPPSLQ